MPQTHNVFTDTQSKDNEIDGNRATIVPIRIGQIVQECALSVFVWNMCEDLIIFVCGMHLCAVR